MTHPDLAHSQGKEPFSKRIQRGVSIKLLTVGLFSVALAAIVISFMEAASTRTHAQALYKAESERQQCDHAIQRLMDASDYLTAQVQQYVITGEARYMNAYWHEAEHTQNRESALAEIVQIIPANDEHSTALASKAESDQLMNGEIWAMRMIAQSEGLAQEALPARVAACELSERDAALTDSQKRQAAIAYVFGPDYIAAKDEIRKNVTAFRNQITNRYSERTMTALSGTQSTSWHTEVLILCVLLVLLCVLGFYTLFVVVPIADYSRRIANADQGGSIRLNPRGAVEIKRFARAFNALYDDVRRNTERLQRLGYVDYLTDVPNRASITEYVERAIRAKKSELGLMIVDVDNFKHYNDTYGHAVGDVTLQQIALAICSAKPATPGISGRLCGEEFVVVMENATPETMQEAAQRILESVRGIRAEHISLPVDEAYRVTVSIGGALWKGEQPTGFTKLLSRADKALYHSKATGKDKYTFFA